MIFDATQGLVKITTSKTKSDVKIRGRYVVIIDSPSPDAYVYQEMLRWISNFNVTDKHNITYYSVGRYIKIRDTNNDVMCCMIRTIIKAYQRVMLGISDVHIEYVVQSYDETVNKNVPIRSLAWDLSYVIYRNLQTQSTVCDRCNLQ